MQPRQEFPASPAGFPGGRGETAVMTIDALLAKLKTLPNCRVTDGAEMIPFLPADWTAPAAVVEPNETAAITEIVLAAENAGASIVPMGGGTKRFTGAPPKSAKPYLLLRLASCNRILAYEPDDLTVTCEPGLTLVVLQTALAAKNQELALDVPCPESATLGGIVSANGSGFQRGAYGAARDLLLGVRAVMAGGVAVAGGGRVVKNVAGYDVCKLFTGAWGTLGIITEITLKVRAKVPAKRVMGWETASVEAAAKIGLALHHAQLAPLFLLATHEYQNQPHLIIGMEGAAERVNWQAEEFTRRLAVAGNASPPINLSEAELKTLLDAQARNDAETVLAARLSCLLTDLPEMARKLEALNLSLTLDCVTGTVSCAARQTLAGLAPRIWQAAPPESALVWTRADANTAERWGTARPDFALHQALKNALDPQNVFSPGRFFGGL